MKRYIIGTCPKCGTINAAAYWHELFTAERWLRLKINMIKDGLNVRDFETDENISIKSCEHCHHCH